MIHLILGLIWLALAGYLLLAQESLAAAGNVAPTNLVILAAGLLATYDLVRWAFWMRSRRRPRVQRPNSKKLDGPIVRPEFDFSEKKKPLDT